MFVSTQEMLLIYSHGDHAFYRRLVFVHYFVFTAGCALCSPIAFGMYGASGFASAFYASAIFAIAVGSFVAVFFGRRLYPTPLGVFGGLVAAEDHLKERTSTVHTPPSSSSATRAQVIGQHVPAQQATHQVICMEVTRT